MVATADRRKDIDALSDEDRWQVMLARDANFDGGFVYGVRSTGISCRPSCSSRRPQHRQVVLFHVPHAAERAGFRPCRPNRYAYKDPQAKRVRRICERITEDSEKIPRLTELAGGAGVNPSQLHRVFKRMMGITPRQYPDAFETSNPISEMAER